MFSRLNPATYEDLSLHLDDGTQNLMLDGYDQYIEEVYADGERQGWSRQVIDNAVRQVNSDRAEESNRFLDALAKVEDRKEAAGTTNWPRPFDDEDDSELEQHRQKRSDDEEFCAAQDSSLSDDSHSVFSADANVSDESSETGAEALPHFGFFRSRLPDRSRWCDDESDNSCNYDDSDDYSTCNDDKSCDEIAHNEIQPNTVEISDDTEPGDFPVHGLTEPDGSSSSFDEVAKMNVCASIKARNDNQEDPAVKSDVEYCFKEANVDILTKSEVGSFNIQDISKADDADAED